MSAVFEKKKKFYQNNVSKQSTRSSPKISTIVNTCINCQRFKIWSSLSRVISLLHVPAKSYCMYLLHKPARIVFLLKFSCIECLFSKINLIKTLLRYQLSQASLDYLLSISTENPAKFRSSHRRCPVRKGVLRNFAKFTRKHLCQSLFLKKRLWHRCFPVNFAKLLRTPCLQNTCGATASESLVIVNTNILWICWKKTEKTLIW